MKMNEIMNAFYSDMGGAAGDNQQLQHRMCEGLQQSSPDLVRVPEIVGICSSSGERRRVRLRWRWREIGTVCWSESEWCSSN
jgi:hypothetical protein